MLFRKENGWEWWMKGLAPSGCEVVENGYHICKEDRSEHVTAETYQAAEDEFVRLSAGKKLVFGQTRLKNGQVVDREETGRSDSVTVGVLESKRTEPLNRKNVSLTEDEKKTKKLDRDPGPPERALIKRK